MLSEYELLIQNGVSQFKQRLKKVIGKEAVSAFAKRAELSEGAIRSMLRGDTQPRLESILKIAIASKTNILWLTTGKGNQKEGLEKLNKSDNEIDLFEKIDSLDLNDLKNANEKIIQVYDGTSSSMAIAITSLLMLLQSTGNITPKGCSLLCESVQALSEKNTKD